MPSKKLQIAGKLPSPTPCTSNPSRFSFIAALDCQGKNLIACSIQPYKQGTSVVFYAGKNRGT
jgi:hypothetical protein